MTNKELKEHNKFLNIAEEIATDSKCVQLHVGAVLVKDKRIIFMHKCFILTNIH